MTHPTAPDPALVSTSTNLPAPRANVPRSAASFLAIMGGLVIIKFLVAQFAPGAFASPEQATVFSWPWIGGLTALGLMGVWFASRVGLPETWDPAIPLRDRVLIPVLLGIGLGFLAIAVDAGTHWSQIVAAKMGMKTIHIAWPASVLIYPGGAVIVNVIYYLALIPTLTWLLSSIVSYVGAMMGRPVDWQSQILFLIAICAALIEPMGDLGLAGHPVIMAVTFLNDLLLNLALVWTFRRAGFGATVVLRVVFYLIWHVANGALAG